MTFVDAIFPLFLGAVLALYWLVQRNETRKIILILASFGFYAAWNWRLCFLLGGVAVVCWLVGLGIARLDRGQAKRLLVIGIAVNLAVLGAFKYYGFFIAQFNQLVAWLGFGVRARVIEIVLPIGISFYIFHAISYIVDLYRGTLDKPRRLTDVMLYISFFPQLVSGPIVRGQHFFPQLNSIRLWRDVAWRAIAILFLIGYLKKAVIADNAAALADPIFADPASFDAFSQFMATVLFGVQIYCDFSGYTDMALAVSALFGYRLRANFDAPYLAASLADFWRRWHISLSFWLRDYLYIPLGGSRGGKLNTAFALMATMVLGGLWHGASWNFVIWGALHGGMLVLYRWSAALREKIHIPWSFAIFVTLWWVSFAWVFFRAENLGRALIMLRGFLQPWSYDGTGLHWGYALMIPILFGIHVMWHAERPIERAERTSPWVIAMASGALVVAIVLLRAPRHVPFIYFQF